MLSILIPILAIGGLIILFRLQKGKEESKMTNSFSRGFTCCKGQILSPKEKLGSRSLPKGRQLQ